MAQFARPDAIVAADSWTGAATAIDEASASDADFINSPNNPNNTVVIGLGDVSTPVDAGTVTLRVRLCRGDADGSTPDAGGTSTNYALELRQGATVIASVSTTAAPTSWTTITRALSAGERGAITDWTDLRVAVTATGGGGSASNRRDVAVSWVELETPNQVVVTPKTGSDAGTGADSATLTAAYGGTTTTTHAADAFNRTQSDTPGTADTGGSYTIVEGSTADWDANGSRMVVTHGSAWQSRAVRLASVSVRDATHKITCQTNKLAGGDYQSFFIRARHAATNTFYEPRVHFNTDQTVVLHLLRNNAGSLSVVGSGLTIPGTHAAGEDWVLEAEITGASPTTIKWRAYKAGDSVPDWQRTETDSTAGALQGAAAVGWGVYLNQLTNNTPVQFSMEDYGVATVTGAAISDTGTATEEATVGQGVFLTPTPVVATVAVPTSTIGRTKSLAPAAIAATTAVPAPTVAQVYALAPNPVPAVTAAPTPTLGRTKGIAPDAVAAVSAVPTPTLELVYALSPAAVAAVTATPTPSVGSVQTVMPDPVAVTLATVAPSITHAKTLAPAAVSAVTATTTSTLERLRAVTPDAVAASLQTVAPTLSHAKTLAPDAVAAVTAIPVPQAGAAITLTPDPVVATLAAPAPTVSLSYSLTPAAVSATVAVPASTVDRTLAVAPLPVAATLDTAAPTLERSLALEPDAVPAVTAVPTPTLTVAGGAITLSPDPVAVSLAVPAPSLARTKTLAADPVAAVLAAPAPTIGLALDIQPDVVPLVLVTPAPTLARILAIAPEAIAATLAIPTPLVAGPAISLAPDAVGAVLAVPVPSLSAARVLAPAPVAVILVTVGPSIEGGPVRPYRATLVSLGPRGTITAQAPIGGVLVPAGTASGGVAVAERPEGALTAVGRREGGIRRVG